MASADAKTIDVETLKMMMAFFAPPSSSPVSLSPSNSKEDALMGADIGRIKDDIKEIKDTLKGIGTTYATVGALNTHVTEDTRILGDHETRVRSLEQQITRIMTWGSIALVGVTLIQIALNFYGK